MSARRRHSQQTPPSAMEARPSVIQRQESFELDPDLTTEMDIMMHIGGPTTTRASKSPVISDVYSRSVKPSIKARSRARPRKTHEPQPFLSLDMIMPEGSQSYFDDIIPTRKCPNRKKEMQELESKSFHGYTKFERSRTTPDMMRRQSPSVRLPSRALTRSYTQVKSPFKHAAKLNSHSNGSERVVTPGLGMKQRTAIAIHHAGQALNKDEGAEVKTRSGRLLKARLKPLYPVNVSGPNINQCRGIQPEPKKYAASPSKTLQRRRQILTNTLYERPRTVESIHQTSVASSLSDHRHIQVDQDIDDFDEEAELNEEYAEQPSQQDTIMNEPQSSESVTFPVNNVDSLTPMVPIPVEGLQMPPNSLASIPYDTPIQEKHINCTCMHPDQSSPEKNQAGANKENQPENLDSNQQDAIKDSDEAMPVDDNVSGKLAENKEEKGHIEDHAADINEKGDGEVLSDVKPGADGDMIRREDQKRDEINAGHNPSPSQQIAEEDTEKTEDTGLSQPVVSSESMSGSNKRPQTVSDPQGKRYVRFTDPPSEKQRPRSASAKVTENSKNKSKLTKKTKSKNSCKEEKIEDSKKKDDDQHDDEEEDRTKHDNSQPNGGENIGASNVQNQTAVNGSDCKNTKQNQQSDEVVCLSASVNSVSFDKKQITKKRVRAKSPARPRSGLAFREFDSVAVVDTDADFEVIGRQSPVKEILSSSNDDESSQEVVNNERSNKVTERSRPSRPKSGNWAKQDQPKHRESAKENNMSSNKGSNKQNKGNVHRGRPLSAVAAGRSQSIPQLTRSEVKVQRSRIPSKSAISVFGSGMYPVYHPGVCINCSRYSLNILSLPDNGLQGNCIKCCNIISVQNEEEKTSNADRFEEHNTERITDMEEECNTDREGALLTNMDDIEKSLSQVQLEIRQCISQIDTLENDDIRNNEDDDNDENDFYEDDGDEDHDIDEYEPVPDEDADQLTEHEIAMNGYLEKCGGRYGEISHTLLTNPGDAVQDEDKDDSSLTECSDSEEATAIESQTEKTSTDCENLEVIATQKTVYKKRVDNENSTQNDQQVAPYPPLCFKINARPPAGFLYYFAYGTDMNLQRISTYIGREPLRMWALLYGFQIVFNKSGSYTEAGGFPNMEFNPFSSIEGYVYLVTPHELEKLDQFVGYPEHYEHVMFPVWMMNSDHPDMHSVAQYCVPALMYIAQDAYTHKGEKLDCSYAAQQCLKGSDKLSTSYTRHLQDMMRVK